MGDININFKELVGVYVFKVNIFKVGIIILKNLIDFNGFLVVYVLKGGKVVNIVGVKINLGIVN